MALPVRFDPVRYIQEARKFGFTQEQAEFNAQEFEHVLDVAIHTGKNAVKEEFQVRDLVTKTDMAQLRSEFKEDMAQLRIEFKGDIAQLKTELKEDMAQLRSEVKADIVMLTSELKQVEFRVETRLIKWVVGVGVASVFTLGGMMLTLFKMMMH